MAKLSELVRGFRANVREGNPCELRFDGARIQLYPLPKEDWDDLFKSELDNEEEIEVTKRTLCGLVTKPSHK